jgi:hypothetical protein
MKKIPITTILFIFLISEFLPNYYVMAENDESFRRGSIQEKGNHRKSGNSGRKEQPEELKTGNAEKV